jgi:hypothetical protein
MSDRVELEGCSLFITNLGGGFILTGLAYFASGFALEGGGNLGWGYAWITIFPALVGIFAFLLWLLQVILLWTRRSQADKRQVVFGIVLCGLVLLAPYLIEMYLWQYLWESSWSLVMSAVMLLWSWIIAAMRMQLWREEEALKMQKYKRE